MCREDVLRVALIAEGAELVGSAVRGIGLIGDGFSVHAPVAILRDPRRSDSAQDAAAQALGWIGDSRAVGPLRSALRSGRWRAEPSATAALIDLGDAGGAAAPRPRPGEP